MSDPTWEELFGANASEWIRWVVNWISQWPDSYWSWSELDFCGKKTLILSTPCPYPRIRLQDCDWVFAWVNEDGFYFSPESPLPEAFTPYPMEAVQ